MSDLSTGTRTGTLDLTTKFLLNFWYLVFKPSLSVDGGEAEKIGWGQRSLTLPAGQHTLDLHVKWAFVFTVAKASTTVTIPEGGAVALTYRAPFIAMPFVKGKITAA